MFSKLGLTEKNVQLLVLPHLTHFAPPPSYICILKDQKASTVMEGSVEILLSVSC